MKKNYKMKKTILATSLFLLSTGILMNTVDAQWSVIDVNSSRIVAELEKFNNRSKGVQETQNIQIKQTDQYQEDTDKRARLAAGVADTARNDIAQIPTIQQCIEMTDQQSRAASVRAGSGGGGAGDRKKPGTKENFDDKIINNEALLDNISKEVTGRQTCGDGMDEALPGCSSKQIYAGADVNQSALTKDFTSELVSGSGLMSNTLNAAAFKAAEAYMFVATKYNGPMILSAEQAKKDPAYVVLYKPVINKLNAAFNALAEIANLRKAPVDKNGKDTVANFDSSSVAGMSWSKGSKDYESLIGAKRPPAPSLFEVINFAVYKAFAGTEKDPGDIQSLNNKIVLSNMIAIQQLKRTETTNILLAHLLTQAVTPTNIEALRTKAATIKNMK